MNPSVEQDQQAGWPLMDATSAGAQQDRGPGTSGDAVRDPGPTPPTLQTQSGGLRASDADRAKVANVLSTAYAEGRLTHEEHDERLDLAMRARTFEDLVPLTTDLVPLDRPLATTRERSATGPLVEPGAATSDPDRFVAVFGGFERKGQWRVRRDNQLLTLFGGGELDLTEATWEGEQIEMTGLTVFGGVEITVPEGVAVRNETVAIFGGAEVDVPPAPAGSPTLVVKGLCLFGGVSVKVRRKGKGKAERAARKHGCGH
ncbi:DUF1707 SHOCT-like domain-containing protein [Auraticoccus monumenti]|uniref:Cell wall-active antibiotics response 4TMS YvqF n=1 Tax=Auraticoccus monumenti TaxID=675864 RepID=A0A1G6VJN6_9ACTN|nr:DUF1707 domain-containing protein [Auraticoccus monumenti]SDD53267.1 Cell wall-active antibiotics response 4TMS YvqF [Auraticoccus monumenti]